MLIKGGGLIYFIHIPRTGGRHIYNMFKHYPIEDNSNPNDKFNGMIKMHLPYPYYKTLYNFNAINLTIGLPFVRISPDHGPNETMIGKNISDMSSFSYAMKFIDKIKK